MDKVDTSRENCVACADMMKLRSFDYEATVLLALLAERDAALVDAKRMAWLRQHMVIASDRRGDWTCWLKLDCIPVRRNPNDADALGLLDELVARFPLSNPGPDNQADPAALRKIDESIAARPSQSTTKEGET